MIMKKLFFAAVAALAIVSVSNVFAGGEKIVKGNNIVEVNDSTNAPVSSDTTVQAPADTATAVQ